MDRVLYLVASTLIKGIQLFPLRTVARMGRFAGMLAYALDGRHRKMAIKNLALCFPENSPKKTKAIARENFRRIGENYMCAVKTASMTIEELEPHVKFIGEESVLKLCTEDHTPSIIIATGHFGNFELYARFGQFIPRFKCAATYRGLRQESLNKILLSLREKSGCLFFERRRDADALKSAMSAGSLMLGFMADQHAAGKGRMRLPFLGRECATNAAAAVFALRYKAPLLTAICYRVGLAQWEIRGGDYIPTHENGKPRATIDITRDVNSAFEAAVIRDPANWFWVHNRWKPAKKKK